MPMIVAGATSSGRRDALSDRADHDVERHRDLALPGHRHEEEEADRVRDREFQDRPPTKVGERDVVDGSGPLVRLRTVRQFTLPLPGATVEHAVCHTIP